MTTPVSYETHLQRIIAKGEMADRRLPRLCFRWVVEVSEVFDQWKADAFPALWHGHVELTRIHVSEGYAPTPGDWLKRHFYRLTDFLRVKLRSEAA